jgi:phosphatidylglycerol lysyltransferase
MKGETSAGSLSFFYKERIHPVIRENRKIIAQFSFTLLFIALGIWFIKHEHAELLDVKNALVSARWQWVLAGIGITAVYIVFQGLMYVYSFAAVQTKVSLFDSTVLFIKRNFISIFLPAGGVSSLVFFSGAIENKGVKKTQIHFASLIYGFTGILSVVIVAIPAFIYAISDGTTGAGEWYALGTIVMLTVFLLLIYRSFMNKGIMYTSVVKMKPSAEVFLNDLQNNIIDRKKFIVTVMISVIIEFIGIAHLYVAMVALNFHPSLSAAVIQ